MTSNVTKLHSSVKGFPARGGSSLVEVNGKVLIFGGADREQTHFQDLTVYNSTIDSYFTTVKTTGDIPMPRSGHAVAGYGKYMFLFGGIDFAEEAVFNDLYILNTDTYEWGYVGESGVEVIARNSHSLGVISDHAHPAKHYLVVYGGASPEHGPLQDTVYAELPEADAIDTASIYVEWKLLPTTTTTPSTGTAEPTVFTKATATASTSTSTLPHPSAREMHGTCTYAGNMYITGGRSESGALLSDVWMLSASSASSEGGASGASVGDASVGGSVLDKKVSTDTTEKISGDSKSDSGDNDNSDSGSVSKSNSELSLASGEENWDNTPPESPTTPNPHNKPVYDNTTAADKSSGGAGSGSKSGSGVKKSGVSGAKSGGGKSGAKTNVTIVDITPSNACTTTDTTQTDAPATTTSTFTPLETTATSVNTTTSATTAGATTGGVCIRWTRLANLELHTPRCAHGAAVSAVGNTHFALHHLQGSADKEVHRSGEVSADAAIHSVESSVRIVLFGGFTMSGVSGDIVTAPLHATVHATSTSTTSTPTATTAHSIWRTNTLSTPIPGRFGLSLCALSVHTLSHIASNRRYHPFVSPTTTACIDNKKVLLHKKSNNHYSVAYNHGGVLLFGGVSIECDFGDVYLIAL